MENLLFLGVPILKHTRVSIYCGPSSEMSRQDGSNEGSQYMVSVRNEKNYPSLIIKYSLLSRALLRVLLGRENCLIAK